MRFKSNLNSTLPPTPIERKEGPGQAHNLDCNSAFGIHEYDAACPRCVIIKKVIFLRRKKVHQGAHVEEYTSAQNLANRLITEYSLTRGETYDNQYPYEQLPQKGKRSKVL